MNINLNELDIREIGEWSRPIKMVSIAIICGFIFILVYWFDSRHQLLELDIAYHEELNLRTTFEQKQAKAANLDAYKRQMATMKISFGALLRQLPEKTEVPGLLEDISHQGLATGLEFRTIRLLPEKQIDFYLELPIEISVVGNYHQFGEFVSNIASLPRIVTLHDFVIKPLNPDGTSDTLLMNITAKTYRYTADPKTNESTPVDQKDNAKK